MEKLEKKDFPLVPNGICEECRLADSCNNRGNESCCSVCMYNPSATPRDYYEGKYSDPEKYNLDDLIES